ncbi:MAG: hypothetical protein HC857_00070 [Synechococcales cyanobacterium RU_4_20]|nr:hypothetical protein [Synechococcales cyanobacterium RU_4_20]
MAKQPQRRLGIGRAMDAIAPIGTIVSQGFSQASSSGQVRGAGVISGDDGGEGLCRTLQASRGQTADLGIWPQILFLLSHSL